MPSLQEVAREAGVSIATASLVLNSGVAKSSRFSPECATRVKAAADKLGYVPNYLAQSMKRGRSNALAVALDVRELTTVNHGILGNNYFGTLLGSIEAEARARGNQVTLVGPTGNVLAFDLGLLGIRQRRFDGMIVPGVTIGPERAEAMAANKPAPIVLVEYRKPSPFPVVDWDEAAGFDMGMDHLTKLGHRNILWLAPVHAPGAARATERTDMFGAYCQRHGIRGENLFFEWPPFEKPYTAFVDAASRALNARLEKGEKNFTAVMCYNDYTGIGALRSLYSQNIRVPDRVSVVSIDDVEAGLSVPGLTSVSHALEGMGARATELLLKMVNDAEQCHALRGQREIIKPTLSVRETTGPAVAL